MMRWHRGNTPRDAAWFMLKAAAVGRHNGCLPRKYELSRETWEAIASRTGEEASARFYQCVPLYFDEGIPFGHVLQTPGDLPEYTHVWADGRVEYRPVACHEGALPLDTYVLQETSEGYCRATRFERRDVVQGGEPLIRCYVEPGMTPEALAQALRTLTL